MSQCPSCGAAVAADQRFCVSCGAPQTGSACPGCGAATTAEMRFCGQCGARLEEMTAALAGATAAQAGPQRATERRLVSVLFADLVGFTSLSEDEDPEIVRDFLSAYFERAAEVIDRYGGTVEKFIGDAVMAVWGAPTAHEDDAERAVRAALDLTAMIGDLDEQTQLRAAVMTGEAAVDPEAKGQGLVAGDLVNSASRLQGVAEPGTVLVDEATMSAAGRAVAFEADGSRTLKGKTEPVRAWRALQVVAQRGGTGRRETLEPPFVGRGEELRLLKDSLHAAGREHKARLVTVVGQAGLGKSRLAWELRKYTDGVTDNVYWHEGQSPAYGEGVAYWALGEMVRARCKIADDTDARAARARIATTLQQYVSDDQEREWIEPRLGALLGLAESPGEDAEELFAAWRTFFERIADYGTVALIFEDLHWADDGLLDFIEHLLEWARSAPIIVVCLARPELLERREGWGSSQRSAAMLHLEPLPDEAMADLLHGLVPGLPEPTLREVVTRAEGVPLYAVETVRMLLDEGRLVSDGERYRLTDASTAVAVPASLQALITARLDSLAAAERSLVIDASVLGKSFSRAGLAAVATHDQPELDDLIRRLVRKQIFEVEAGRSPEERGQYAFVQSLLRDVAYSTLSRRDRRERHVAAARYFESLEDGELAGIVASHYYDAYRAAPEGPEGEAAAGWASVALRAAAERSISVHANRAAVNFIEQALTITHDPDERAELQVMAAIPAWASTDVSVGERYIVAAIDWYLENGRDDEADEAIATMAGYMLHVQPTSHTQLLEERVARVDDNDPRPSAPRLLNELARAYLYTGNVDGAFEPLDRGIRIAERLLDERVIAELLATKSWASGLRGQQHESTILAEGSVRLAERYGMSSTEMRGRMNLSDLLVGTEPRRGFEMAGAGVALAERVGHATWAAALAGNQSFAALVLGEWRAAIENAEQFDRPHVSRFSRNGLVGTALVARAYLGLATEDELAMGSGPDPVEAADVQLRSMRDAYGAWARFAAGQLDDVDRLAIASASGTANFGEAALAGCQAVHAVIWLRDRERLVAVLDHLTTHGWAGVVKAITISQGQAALAAMDGRFDEAEAGYDKALGVWRSLEMRPDVAIAQMEMLLLMGDRLANRDALADDARRLLTELGAVSLLERLESVVSGPGPVSTSASPAPSTDPVQESPIEVST